MKINSEMKNVNCRHFSEIINFDQTLINLFLLLTLDHAIRETHTITKNLKQKRV